MVSSVQFGKVSLSYINPQKPQRGYNISFHPGKDLEEDRCVSLCVKTERGIELHTIEDVEEAAMPTGSQLTQPTLIDRLSSMLQNPNVT